jgi:hypothetical protein
LISSGGHHPAAAAVAAATVAEELDGGAVNATVLLVLPCKPAPVLVPAAVPVAAQL